MHLAIGIQHSAFGIPRRYNALVKRPWCLLATLFAFTSAPLRAVTATDPRQFTTWGLDVQNQITASLGLPQSPLFAESASLSGVQSGGAGGMAYVWPLSTELRVEDSLVRLNPAVYAPQLRQFSDALYADYWSTQGGGYRSGTTAGSTRFYDDNAHLAVALAEAYQLTSDPIYLTRAQQTYNFVLSGEDSVGGGGIYWNEFDRSFKDSAATLQGARAGLMLYEITGQSRYLTDAQRLYGWAQRTVQQPNGLFMEKLFLTGPQAGTVGNYTLINFAGFGLSDNILFYDITGNVTYLHEAQRIASASIPRYFNSTTGAINDEGFWDFELVDALDELYQRDNNPLWLGSIEKALQWLHANRQDPNGHYGTLWGRGGLQTAALSTWDLNDQASVARSYLFTGSTPGPWFPDADHDGTIGFDDLVILAQHYNSPGSIHTGDFNADGKVDFADLVLLARHYGQTLGDAQLGAAAAGFDAGGSSPAASVPEPASLGALLLAGAILARPRR